MSFQNKINQFEQSTFAKFIPSNIKFDILFLSDYAHRMQILNGIKPKQYMNIRDPKSIHDIIGLRNIILNDLVVRFRLDPETIPILGLLYQMNFLGFITFESQPYRVSYLILREYVNGLFPSKLVPIFVSLLQDTDPNIIVSETKLLTNKKKELKIHGDISGVTLKFGFYPMAETKGGSPVEGYSGAVSGPAETEIYFEDFAPILTKQFEEKMSLLQIWSRNLEPGIMKSVVKILKILYPKTIKELINE